MAKKKKRKQLSYKEVELNVMPFIDVFSLLNTFLLMSAVFLTIGVIEVQIPFLTNAPPPDDAKPTRSLDIKVDMEKEQIAVVTSYSLPPIDEDKKSFDVDERGIAEMHSYLVSLRQQNPESDKVSFYTGDDVIWKDMAAVLDAVKLRQPADPVFSGLDILDERKKAEAMQYLFPKVILSSVML